MDDRISALVNDLAEQQFNMLNKHLLRTWEEASDWEKDLYVQNIYIVYIRIGTFLYEEMNRAD